MSTFTKKDWVCLVDEDVLQRASSGDYLFRQIAISADAELVTVRLMNVDRTAAAGGYCCSGTAPKELKFAWDDLNDLDAISRRFQREQLAVFRKIAEMLVAIREHMVPLRAALAA